MGERNINNYFKYRKTEQEVILKYVNNPKAYKKLQNELEESVLSIEITKTYNFLLSWGEPADGFKVDTNKNNELKNIRYWFSDWHTYDEIKLEANEADNFLSVYAPLLDEYKIKY